MTLHAHLKIRRGEFALDVAIEAAPGEVVALLGPNGSGKTTALHALAGLVPLDGGAISLDGELLDDPVQGTFVHPHQRAVSLVFQEYLLFPHLSALDNVAFGLRARGMGRAEAQRQATAMLDRFGLADKARAKPSHLSGGQAQRVAIARALATEPSLLLLDEPLAALDATTRATVRRDLRAHLAAFGGVAVVVTHDALDALALASRVVVLDGGSVTQDGPIAELAARPRSRYVADLVGLNLLHGHATGFTVTVASSGERITVADRVDGDVYVLIAPRSVALHTSEPDGSPRNRWPAMIAGFDLLGDRVRVRVDGPVPLVAEITAAAFTTLALHEGQSVWVAVKATEITTYPR